MKYIKEDYVDITSVFHKKLNILTLYESEMLPYPQTRNESSMTALILL